MSLAPLPVGSWSPEVHRRLTALLEGPAGHAVLDWDDTVIEGDLSLAMMREADRSAGTTWHDTYFALLEAHGRGVAYPQITRWWAGTTPAALDVRFGEIVRAALARGEVRWRPDMVALAEALRTRGWTLWVVTASPAVLVQQLARHLHIPDNHVLGMRLHVGPDGRYTDVIVEPATWGEGKRAALEATLPGAPDLVAGDSASDAPMLRIARHALLIDGHDAVLRVEALASGWMIQSGWNHTPAEPGVQTSHG